MLNEKTVRFLDAELMTNTPFIINLDCKNSGWTKVTAVKGEVPFDFEIFEAWNPKEFYLSVKRLPLNSFKTNPVKWRNRP